MNYYRKIGLSLLLGLLILSSTNAQDVTDDPKTWFGYGIKVAIGKRIKINVGQLYSVNLPEFTLGFMQTDIMVAYKIYGKHYIKFDFSNSQYRRSSVHTRLGFSENILNWVGFQRFTLRYDYGHRLIPNNKNLNFKHKVLAQVFFPRAEKHRARFIYTARLYYTDKRWPWRISPYLAFSLQYYLGGVPIVYYNEQGDVIAYNSPDGFHRFRFKTGFSLRPLKKHPLTCTFYVIWQWEFNNGLFPNRELNYTRPPMSIDNISHPYDPSLSRIQQPFNNYIAVGLHVSYTINVKLKKKKKKKKDNAKSRQG